MKVDYAIYPTLLDSFYWYKVEPFEKFQELINKINRVKTVELPENVLRGIQFENVINDTLDGLIVQHDYGKLVDNIATILNTCIKKQEYIEAVLEIKGLNILVYGFVDYSFPTNYVDLKTTENYKAGKYRFNNQHTGYTLINKINKGCVNKFTYLVTDFKQLFSESYEPNSEDHDRFIFNILEFIEWLEYYKCYITDLKIFGK